MKELDHRKIVASIGAILFLLSGVLPLISDTFFSLFNLYVSIWQLQQGPGQVTINVETIGILLTIILYPVAVILGFVSIDKRRIAMVAGILGLTCWFGTLTYLASLGFVSHAGFGVYIGIVGAIFIVIAYFLKPSSAPAHALGTSVTAMPPPPPQEDKVHNLSFGFLTDNGLGATTSIFDGGEFSVHLQYGHFPPIVEMMP